MNRTIYFDMDGTIVDLYGYPNWLKLLREHNPTPYEKAVALCNLNRLARRLNNLQKKGYKLGVITWLAKNSTESYDKLVIEKKIGWLKKHLRSVNFDKVRVLDYGTPKHFFATENDILFDDNEEVRAEWVGEAYSEKEIFEVLGRL